MSVVHSEYQTVPQPLKEMTVFGVSIQIIKSLAERLHQKVVRVEPEDAAGRLQARHRTMVGISAALPAGSGSAAGSSRALAGPVAPLNVAFPRNHALMSLGEPFASVGCPLSQIRVNLRGISLRPSEKDPAPTDSLDRADLSDETAPQVAPAAPIETVVETPHAQSKEVDAQDKMVSEDIILAPLKNREPATRQPAVAEIQVKKVELPAKKPRAKGSASAQRNNRAKPVKSKNAEAPTVSSKPLKVIRRRREHEPKIIVKESLDVSDAAAETREKRSQDRTK